MKPLLDLALLAHFVLLSLCSCALMAAEPQAREDDRTVTLENDHARLVFDKEAKGALMALVDKKSGLDLCAPPARPRRLYAIGWTGEDGKTIELGNDDASEARYEIQRSPGEARLVETFANHAGRKLTAIVTVALRSDSPLSEWRVEVKNEEAVALKQVTFPIVPARLTITNGGEGDAIALPVCDGILIERPLKTISKGGGRRGSYPGMMSAQFMAYCGAPVGLYLAAMDAAGRPKEFGLTRTQDAFAFSYTHRFPEEQGKGWTMPYAVALGPFHGDWHAAADLYKAWALKQFWCAKTLAQRDDIPAWVKEAPVFHTLSARAGSKEKGKYNSLPVLPAHVRRFCEALKAKECAMIMAWEQHGTWVTPHYFPPFGGADLFRQATSEILKDGNHTLVFLSGLKWTLKKGGPPPTYDDSATFEKDGAKWAVAGPDGEPLISGKPETGTGQSAQLCPATPYARDLLMKIALECVDLGITCVQMDQVVGMGTPPCYSKEHGHPLGHGVWQYERLRDLFAQMRTECRKRNPDFAFSIEEPHELAIPLLDVYHARDYAQGHWPRSLNVRGVPIFTYLYHEYVLGYGGDSAAPWRSDMCQLQQALNLVCGKTAGIAVWGSLVEPEKLSPESLRMLKAHTNLLSTSAREYLVFGRMIHPLPFDTPSMSVKLSDIHSKNSAVMDFPSVLQSGWALPNGNRAYFFVNIAKVDMSVQTEVPAPEGPTGPATIATYSTDTAQRASLGTVEQWPRKIAFVLKPQEACFVEIVPTK